MKPKKIIISRTDSIGDVVLTLPMAGVIKEKFPDCEVLFLGKNYTKPVIDLSIYVDKFVSWDELQKAKDPVEELKMLAADTIIHVFPNKQVASLAKKAKIQNRIGTSGRIYHQLNCNYKVNFSRKKSDLHESQLNMKLLEPVCGYQKISLKEMQNYYGFEKVIPLKQGLRDLLDKSKYNLILHPKSKNSAKEWGLVNFKELIAQLPKDQFKIFISGTEEEKELINKELPLIDDQVTSLLGKMSLSDFISFIYHSDGLVAASTGPLHISAALNKRAIGLYAPKRPIHPGRWMPVGQKAEALVYDKNCELCRKGKECNCIEKISSQEIIALLK